MFQALVLESEGHAVLRELSTDLLPRGAVRIAVLYSSLNYKDALAVTGKGKIIRAPLPFVPGIDLVGRVTASELVEISEGDMVLQTGGGLGEETGGGYTQQQSVSGQWLTRLPENISPRHSMVIGTAGFTAMQAVMALEENGFSSEKGDVLVTGASGGVGSFAVAILASMGCRVVASTGKISAHDYLYGLGAGRIIDRAELGQGTPKPLASAQWAGAIDTVGGTTLATILSSLKRHASVAACGNASGHRLETTVFPFILRGVNLLGIDSNRASLSRRYQVWKRLSEQLSESILDVILAETIPLKGISRMSERMLDGAVTGRVVVDVNA